MEQQKQRLPNVIISPYSSVAYLQQQQSSIQECSIRPPECSTHLFTSNFNKRSHLNKNGHLNQIKGPTGSVRGHRDVVRRSLENLSVNALNNNRRNFNSSHLISFMAQPVNKLLNVQQLNERRNNYLESLTEEEQDLCVAYVTTLGIIRRTFEDSKQMKSILNLNLIRFEERDIYLNQEYKNQLMARCNSIKVPALFIDGQFIGGIKELELLNESGKLPLLLAKFKMSKAMRDICMCCGSAKFIACPSCNGSGKFAIHRFRVKLRCIRCDKNDGLIQCPMCFSNNNNRTIQEIKEEAD